MNRKKLHTALIRAKGKASHLRNRVGGGMLVAMAALPAWAQTGASEIEAIKAEIDAWKSLVVGLVIAFAVVLWAIRAATLAKPR